MNHAFTFSYSISLLTKVQFLKGTIQRDYAESVVKSLPTFGQSCTTGVFI